MRARRAREVISFPSFLVGYRAGYFAELSEGKCIVKVFFCETVIVTVSGLNDSDIPQPLTVAALRISLRNASSLLLGFNIIHLNYTDNVQ